MLGRFITIILITIVLLGTSAVVFTQNGDKPGTPLLDASSLALPESEPVTGVAPELSKAAGEIQVVIRLVDPALSAAVGREAKQKGSTLSPGQQKEYLNSVDRKQTALLTQITAMGGKELARVSKALDAVIVSVNASRLAEIAALPNVASIRPVINYQADLSETVPYIGAKEVQDFGYDGTGVRVAVLDSGIDYTHYNLGGSGIVADFNNNDPTIVEPGTFPTQKVIGGYDFVGELWDGSPSIPLAPDPDPLDKGVGAGHGTHVADITAGKSNDGVHKGVAPGASLYAVGVCSKKSTSCSGIAILQGMDFALDPNGDGDIGDAVDVANLSLGMNYGQREDDLGAACANAVHMGVVVVAAAGNAADKPYIVSSPSSTPEVISVAETQIPSAKLYRIVADSVSAGGSWQPWSAVPALVTGPLQYGNGTGGNLIGCNAFAAGSLANKILLVDRGTCAISLKVSNGAAAGALAVIVANNLAQAPGDLPPDFSYGGGAPSVAGYSITRADGLALKTVLGQMATIDPATAVPLVKNMVSSSSRGPSYSFGAIKPDIAAPGASVSAIYGTGNGETAFGGTSGATPMISGSVALLLQRFPGITPLETKARLMNTGETDIGINPVGLPGYLAPVTRIGGGEVRVNNAANAATVAWDADDLTGSLSFGYNALTGSKAFKKTVVVRNYESNVRTYSITPSFRYADDAASGAVSIKAPESVKVPPNGSATFNVMLKIDVTKLPVWNLNGGSWGGDGYRLQGFEFDGYINIQDSDDDIHVAWQILPHRSAEVTPGTTRLTLTNGTGSLMLSNAGGAIDGRVDVFSLLGTSGRIPPPLLPNDGDNFAIVDLKNFGARLVGLGGGQFAIQFAVSTFGTRAHPNYPAEFDIFLDTNRDGVFDFVLFNAENGGFGATGQSLIYVYNLATSNASAYFYSDASLNSGNVIFTAPLAALGMTPNTQFDVSVYAFDNYFTGNLTDAIEGMTYTAGMPRYYPDNYAPVVPQSASSNLNIFAPPGGDTASPSQKGLLLMYRDAREQREADAIFILQ